MENTGIVEENKRRQTEIQTLQTLTRRAVVTSLKGSPGDLKYANLFQISKLKLLGSAVELLPVPPPIKDFLLFSDMNAEAMIKQYEDTMEHVSNNGSSNVLVI